MISLGYIKEGSYLILIVFDIEILIGAGIVMTSMMGEVVWCQN